MVVSALLAAQSPEPPNDCIIDFITCTNTLGSCLVLDPITHSPALPSASVNKSHSKPHSNESTDVHNDSTNDKTTAQKVNNNSGLAGLAGSALHPLSLGNVATFRHLLDAHPSTSGILIIGVGGVHDNAGFERMRAVGAEAVGVATVLGRKGTGVFQEILTGETDGSNGHDV